MHRLDQRQECVRSTTLQARARGGVVHELWYGVAKSKKREFNTERVRAFLSGPIHLIHFDDADARAAGEVRALLEHEKRPIGAYDSLIAGQAVRRGFTLVTANVREFERVDGLVWEDWTD